MSKTFDQGKDEVAKPCGTDIGADLISAAPMLFEISKTGGE
jgi:hypothetical protein